jgi:hypothetical protein
MELMESDFQEWKQHPVTLEYHKFLKKVQDEAKDDWSNGLFVGENEYETNYRNVHALGGIYTINKLLDISVEDIKEVLYGDK